MGHLLKDPVCRRWEFRNVVTITVHRSCPPVGGNGCHRGVLILVDSQLFHYYFWMLWLGGGDGMGMNKCTFFSIVLL